MGSMHALAEASGERVAITVPFSRHEIRAWLEDLSPGTSMTVADFLGIEDQIHAHASGIWERLMRETEPGTTFGQMLKRTSAFFEAKFAPGLRGTLWKEAPMWNPRLRESAALPRWSLVPELQDTRRFMTIDTSFCATLPDYVREACLTNMARVDHSVHFRMRSAMPALALVTARTSTKLRGVHMFSDVLEGPACPNLLDMACGALLDRSDFFTHTVDGPMGDTVWVVGCSATRPPPALASLVETLDRAGTRSAVRIQFQSVKTIAPADDGEKAWLRDVFRGAADPSADVFADLVLNQCSAAAVRAIVEANFYFPPLRLCVIGITCTPPPVLDDQTCGCDTLTFQDGCLDIRACSRLVSVRVACTNFDEFVRCDQTRRRSCGDDSNEWWSLYSHL